jgi:hypothetical protein
MERAKLVAELDLLAPYNSLIYVDGKMLPVTAATLELAVGEITYLVLKIPVVDENVQVLM